jgi:hypothetical protein
MERHAYIQTIKFNDERRALSYTIIVKLAGIEIGTLVLYPPKHVSGSITVREWHTNDETEKIIKALRKWLRENLTTTELNEVTLNALLEQWSARNG